MACVRPSGGKRIDGQPPPGVVSAEGGQNWLPIVERPVRIAAKPTSFVVAQTLHSYPGMDP
jgi:hypothetical protein